MTFTRHLPSVQERDTSKIAPRIGVATITQLRTRKRNNVHNQMESQNLEMVFSFNLLDCC